MENTESSGPSDYQRAQKADPSFSTVHFADIIIISQASFYCTVVTVFLPTLDVIFIGLLGWIERLNLAHYF